jgi:hypothetical protein
MIMKKVTKMKENPKVIPKHKREKRNENIEPLQPVVQVQRTAVEGRTKGRVDQTQYSKRMNIATYPVHIYLLTQAAIQITKVIPKTVPTVSVLHLPTLAMMVTIIRAPKRKLAWRVIEHL